jgi:hypothetical protein
LVGGTVYTLSRAAALADPELATLRECLVHHQQLSRQIERGERAKIPARDALQAYVAGRFAPVITNELFWSKLSNRLTLTDPLRAEANRILRTIPSPSPEQFDHASREVERFFGQSPDAAALEALHQVTLPLAVVVVTYANGVIFVIIPCLVFSLLFRGGLLLKLLGIVLVTRNGTPASRWRVAWLPFVVLILPVNLLGLAPVIGQAPATLVAVTLTTGLAILSVLLPDRGLADRLSGTWPVPR